MAQFDSQRRLRAALLIAGTLLAACSADPASDGPSTGSGGSHQNEAVGGSGGQPTTPGPSTGGSNDASWGGQGPDVGLGGEPVNLGGSGGDISAWDGGGPSTLGGAAGGPPAEEQDGRCAASESEPASIATVPTPECKFLEIAFPGVFEYSAAAPGPEKFNAGSNTYTGCDAVGDACVGAIEYTWKVEYVTENEWTLWVYPVHEDCSYDHASLWTNNAGVSYTIPISWKQAVVTLHLQPIPTGYRVGSVRTLEGNLVSGSDFVTQSGGVGKALAGAFVEHLKSLEWDCIHD